MVLDMLCKKTCPSASVWKETQLCNLSVRVDEQMSEACLALGTFPVPYFEYFFVYSL